ncbi:recombinase family protein [Emticicia sp. 17c]|uniref:recombinase family protein n=1 Tax=Emticicia sp. 17c TaxID=3127704 RepID=UPI00301BA63E
MKKYLAYIRVSTKGQERSGLGLEAQKAIINYYADIENAIVIDTFIETESGKEIENRPKLNEAINYCLKHNTILVVAKLDRLSRDVEHIFNIHKRLGDKFKSCDLPVTDALTLSVFAGLAQREREIISIRTKLALEAKKKQGVKLGKPENLTAEARRKGVEAIKAKAKRNSYNRVATALIEKCKRENKTLQEIADELNQNGFKTSQGKLFNPISVSRLYKRIKQV